MKLLIRHGRLVDPAGGIGGIMDILVENGAVVMIGSDLCAPRALSRASQHVPPAAG